MDFIRAIFTGFENGNPLILTLSFFSYETDDKLTVSHSIVESKNTAVAIGHSAAIDSSILMRKTWKGGAKKSVLKLFDKQILATPTYVAKPIDILFIRKQHHRMKRIK